MKTKEERDAVRAMVNDLGPETRAGKLILAAIDVADALEVERDIAKAALRELHYATVVLWDENFASSSSEVWDRFKSALHAAEAAGAQ